MGGYLSRTEATQTEQKSAQKKESNQQPTDIVSEECITNHVLAAYCAQINKLNLGLKPDKVFDMQDALLTLAKNADANLHPIQLDINERQGSTDYIDFIKPEEMLSCIMYGRDYAERPFFSLLLHFEPIPETGKTTEKTGFDNVITLFKRYTDHERWTHAISHGKQRVEIFESATDKIEMLAKTAILCSGRSLVVTYGYDYVPTWTVSLQKQVVNTK
jgi:hypothetical protein